MTPPGSGYCACGCGGRTAIAEKNMWRKGVLICPKGQRRKYLPYHMRLERVPLADRIWKHVDKEGAGGCWIWTGSIVADGARAGYGHVQLGGGKTTSAHMAMWTLLRGAVPDGLELDHRCRVRACCNPDHLEPVTHAENMRRSGMLMTGRCRKRQHEVTASDVYVSPRGRTMCKLCIALRQSKSRAA